jgi:DNA-binding NtrC family response regulator
VETQRVNIAQASLDVSLSSSREALLRNAGYAVKTVRSAAELRECCKRERFDLLMVGNSIEYSARKEIRSFFRSVYPDAPILQLILPSETPDDADYNLDPHKPDDLLRLVQDIFPAGR